MSILVVAEHDGAKLLGATRCAVRAATRIGSPIDVVVAGHGIDAIAAQAAAIPGVVRVLKADAAHLAKPTSEALAALVLALADKRTHILFSNTAMGKGTAPRVAALLDVAQISEIASVIDQDTFVRPIYAGSVLATFRSRDAVKVITVRTTNFEAVAPEGGSATVENVAVPADPGVSKVVAQEASKSDRPGAHCRSRGHLGRARCRQWRKLSEAARASCCGPQCGAGCFARGRRCGLHAE